MSSNAQIRASLSVAPMTMDQLTDANDWDAQDRKLAYRLLAQLKSKGEIKTRVEEGKATYSLVAGYVPPKPGRKPRGPSLHFARGDKTPKAETKPASGDTKVPIGETKAPPRIFQRRKVVVGVERQSPELEYSATLRIVGGATDFNNLGKRFDVVAEDIKQLVADALDADVDRDLIKDLIAANNALNRAARLYARRK